MHPEIETAESINRERIAGWWQLLGIEPEYPTDTITACRLCQAVDYRVDPDWVTDAIQSNIIPPVPGMDGRFEWKATNIVTLAAALEARRRWKPFSQIHAHKITRAEMLTQICEGEGASAFSDLDRFDVEGLLGAIVDCALSWGGGDLGRGGQRKIETDNNLTLSFGKGQNGRPH